MIDDADDAAADDDDLLFQARDLYTSHFEKFIPKRTEQVRSTTIFKDTSDLFACSTAGFNAIRTHLSETEARWGRRGEESLSLTLDPCGYFCPRFMMLLSLRLL